MKYIIEWEHTNGRRHSTYANSPEMAEQKAVPLVADNDIIKVEILECISVKILKTPFDKIANEGEE